MDGRVEFLNPDGLPRNPAFSNVAVVSGSVRTIYIGGQDAVDAEGNIVGIGDIAAQTEQVLRNLRTALAAASAGPEHVVKWNVLVVDGQDFACRLRGVPASVGRPTQSSGHHGRRREGPRPPRLPRRDGRDRGRSCLTSFGQLEDVVLIRSPSGENRIDGITGSARKHGPVPGHMRVPTEIVFQPKESGGYRTRRCEWR